MNSNSSFKARYHVGKYVKNMFMGYFTEYETPKLVSIHSQKQSTTITSSVALKVKGIGYVNTSENKTLIIDGADYIIPPLENNAIFIMTNFIQTDQTRSTCAESEKLKEAICHNDSQCFNKSFTPNMNGRWTGRCLLSSEKDIGNETTNITIT
ncbi:unnamed protein product, partial [Rotaria sp. Silwood1]